MKYAIIGLGLAALVVGCDSAQHFASPDSVQAPTPQIDLTCKADGGVERLELTAVPIDDKDIPGWATKTCGPIRKATYPPPAKSNPETDNPVVYGSGCTISSDGETVVCQENCSAGLPTSHLAPDMGRCPDGTLTSGSCPGVHPDPGLNN